MPFKLLSVASFFLSAPLLGAPPPSSSTPVPVPWIYQLDLLPSGQIAVAIDFGTAAPGAISVLEKVRPTLTHLQTQSDAGTKALSTLTGMLELQSCRRGCKVSYQIDLRAAVAALDDSSRLALRPPHLIQGNPATWLLHPLEGAAEQPVELHATPAMHANFAVGLYPGPSPGTWISTADKLHDLPFAVVGRLNRRRFDLAGGQVEMILGPGPLPQPEAAISAWVLNAAKSVTAYLGHYPVPKVLVFVSPDPRPGAIGGGVTLGDGGAAIMVSLGKDTTAKDLAEDWVMTHEMVHLALPAVSAEHHWIEEGLATYAEPIARMRHGTLKPETVFAEMYMGLPQGLPKDGDEGLDHTPTWGRTYWGGALFWFLADIDLRRTTKGRYGVEDALNGLYRAGASHAERWDLEEMLAVCDKATGTDVLKALYQRFKNKPEGADLPRLWQELGVKLSGHSVAFDAVAPLAKVRFAIIHGTKNQ